VKRDKGFKTIEEVIAYSKSKQRKRVDDINTLINAMKEADEVVAKMAHFADLIPEKVGEDKWVGNPKEVVRVSMYLEDSHTVLYYERYFDTYKEAIKEYARCKFALEKQEILVQPGSWR